MSCHLHAQLWRSRSACGRDYPCQEDPSGPPQLTAQGEGIAVRGRSLAAGPGLPTPLSLVRLLCSAGPARQAASVLWSTTDDERHRSRSALPIAVSRLHASARALRQDQGLKPTVAGSVAMTRFGQKRHGGFRDCLRGKLPLAVVGHTHRDRPFIPIQRECAAGRDMRWVQTATASGKSKTGQKQRLKSP